MLLNLHPLRFTSVLVAIAAACAVALVATFGTEDAARWRIGAVLALSGFMLKLPIATILGFSLILAERSRALNAMGLALTAGALLALLIPGWDPVVSSKDILGAAVAIGIVALVGLREPVISGQRGGLIALLGVVVLLVTAVPLSRVAPAALAVLPALLLIFPCWRERIPLPVHGLALALPVLLLFHLMQAEAERLLIAAITLTGVMAVAIGYRLFPRFAPQISAAVAIGVPAALLLAAGLAQGLVRGFTASPGSVLRDFVEAQRWARAETLPGTVFVSPDAPGGFAVLSRRPVWWEHLQASAELWAPGFYDLWACRRARLADLSPDALFRVMAKEGIGYAVLSTARVRQSDFGAFDVAFTSPNWTVLRVPAGASTTPSASTCG
jgi:hypothetical protein